ncbi:MAG: nucleotidyltransferase domain-containing protein [Ardenticatenaceae bacterium]|nr:nucleotidyltransferase domain-containing protein [Ardenticatenaceae bacterium]
MEQQWQEKIEAWCRERPLRLCVLFGSQATGRSHAQSDVDLAVWPAKPVPAMTKLQWLVELQKLLDKEVSLVLVTPDLDPVLGFEIVRDGRLLYERDPNTWLKARSQLWYAYNDSLPFRRAAREQLRQFAQEIRRGT